MACGAPVVCSNAGPLPEVAGDAAVLLKPQDARVWAAAMLGVLTNSADSNELRQRGFARVKMFSWDAAARATREVYHEALLA
jgi:glycosyltransferase involved in cell wall biosynthesis